MKKKLFRNCHWFSLAVCLSSLLFCANPIVAQNNMYLNQKIKYTSRKTTREKLMTYLNDQAKMKGSNDFTIPFNRQELADYLGVERSAMSAELGKLTKLGILRTQRSHFTLLKPLD